MKRKKIIILEICWDGNPNEDKTYEVDCKCHICHIESTVRIEKGKRVGEAKCPNCGQTNCLYRIK